MQYIIVWRDSAAMHRQFAELAKCDEARDDHLLWARFYEKQADYMARNGIDYSAITRDVALLS